MRKRRIIAISDDWSSTLLRPFGAQRSMAMRTCCVRGWGKEYIYIYIYIYVDVDEDM